MKYEEFVQRDRYAAALAFLLAAEGTANERSLLSALKSTQFPRLTEDKLRRDLRELERKGCLEIEWLNDDLAVASLTRRGQDCAHGDIEIEGIAKPDRIR